ncbi:MAG: DUF3540 domain-containing protein [Gemmatimonadales bacterium]|nr:MAG: DUF3540 domain-containing protein [Gemmatimonadales bacterium]
MTFVDLVTGHASSRGHVGPATVLPPDPASTSGALRLDFPNHEAGEGPRPVAGTLASVSGVRPGSRVLAMEGSDGQVWVLGVLAQGTEGGDGHAGSPATGELRTSTGARATVEDGPEGERLILRDAGDVTLVSHDASTGTTRIHSGGRRLAIDAPEGDLELRAGRTLRLSGQEVEVTATSSLRLLVREGLMALPNLFRMGRRRTEIRSEGVRVETREMETRTESSVLRAGKVTTRADRICTKTREMEVDAEMSTERLGSFTQVVTGLVRRTAGALRSRISGTWQTRAGRADLRTRETFKVDGERIHLG